MVLSPSVFRLYDGQRLSFCLHAHIELSHLCQLFDGLLYNKLSGDNAIQPRAN